MNIRMKPSLALTLLVFMVTLANAQEKLTAEDILRHHLDSIGTASTRAATKSRVVEGTASYRVLVGGSGQIDGRPVPL